ncbi:MAG: DUF3999 domain-containing protein [Lentisphaerae bacterium]|nr:DUF3999 domain-containing protein [Lentisphaerota bacterium]
MKTSVCFLVLLACAASLPAAAPDNFAATRGILSGPLDAPGLVEVRLDAPLFALTRPGFPDLRLFDDAGTERPRLIEPLYTTESRTTRHSLSARATDLRELPGNRIEARFTIDPDAPPPAGLDIRTPLKDFIRTVRISGSDDGQTWHPLVPEAEIFDYTRYMDVRRTEIPLPSNAFRHFSIEIGNASEERAQPLIRLVRQDGRDASRAFDLLQTPFRIDGISFWHETTRQAKDQPVLRDWPQCGIEVSQDTKAKTTEIRVQTRHTPVTRLVLETPARNFQRTAEVQAEVSAAGSTVWRTIGAGTFTRIDLPGCTRDEVAIDIPETRAPRLRLLLRNADNPPIVVDNLLLRGPVYRLLWLADPGTAYRLAAGHAKLPAPAYDLFAIRTALTKGLAPALWELAPADPATDLPKSFSLGEFLSRPLVFGSALALAAIVLLLLLANALKKAP